MIGDVPYLVPLHSHNTGRRSLFCPISPYLFLLVPPDSKDEKNGVKMHVTCRCEFVVLEK
jgi:hypothetical protein